MSPIATASELAYLTSVSQQISAELNRMLNSPATQTRRSPVAMTSELVRDRVITVGMKDVIDGLLTVDHEELTTERLGYVRDMAPKVLELLKSTPPRNGVSAAGASATSRTSSSHG